jgi:hypothetical protein
MACKSGFGYFYQGLTFPAEAPPAQITTFSIQGDVMAESLGKWWCVLTKEDRLAIARVSGSAPRIRSRSRSQRSQGAILGGPSRGRMCGGQSSSAPVPRDKSSLRVSSPVSDMAARLCRHQAFVADVDFQLGPPITNGPPSWPRRTPVEKVHATCSLPTLSAVICLS